MEWEDKSNNVIQSLWVGKKLSVMEKLCIKSFLANRHEFHLYCYSEIEGIPDGTTINDANEILEYSKIFMDSRNSIASFSDWFRYKMLYEKGGWWVDMDTVCLRRFDIEEEYCFSSEGYSNADAKINNGIIKAPRESDVFEECLTFIRSQDMEKVVWGSFGPRLLRSVLSQYDCQKYTQLPDVFCPIHWPDTRRLIAPQDFSIPQKTMAIHLWNEIWRLEGLSKDTVYHPESIYEKLKVLYNIKSPH